MIFEEPGAPPGQQSEAKEVSFYSLGQPPRRVLFQFLPLGNPLGVFYSSFPLGNPLDVFYFSFFPWTTSLACLISVSSLGQPPWHVISQFFPWATPSACFLLVFPLATPSACFLLVFPWVSFFKLQFYPFGQRLKVDP